MRSLKVSISNEMLTAASMLAGESPLGEDSIEITERRMEETEKSCACSEGKFQHD